MRIRLAAYVNTLAVATYKIYYLFCLIYMIGK